MCFNNQSAKVFTKIMDKLVEKTPLMKHGEVKKYTKANKKIDEHKKEKKNICSSFGGIICIAIAVIDWVLMSEIIQSSE